MQNSRQSWSSAQAPLHYIVSHPHKPLCQLTTRAHLAKKNGDKWFSHLEEHAVCSLAGVRHPTENGVQNTRSSVHLIDGCLSKK
jgi:hypothetical protein